MKRVYFLVICFIFFLTQASKAQYKSTGNPFRGSFGVTLGYSALDVSDFQRWLSSNGGSLISSNFLNLGLEGFVVRKGFVAGFTYRYDGPATFGYQSGRTSPKNDKIGAMIGYDPMPADNDKHVLFTLGFGYCENSARFHGNPPYMLQDPQIPNNLARLKQPNFYINPKITLLYVKKVKLGVEAGATFCFFLEHINMATITPIIAMVIIPMEIILNNRILNFMDTGFREFQTSDRSLLMSVPILVYNC